MKPITSYHLAKKCKTPKKLSSWLWWNVKYVTDESKHGVKDYWQTPDQTIRDGTGDCDDYSLLCNACLNVWGIQSYLIFMETWDGYKRWESKAHMVCMYYQDRRWYMFDLGRLIKSKKGEVQDVFIRRVCKCKIWRVWT